MSAPRQRSFPDTPERFEHFVPDDGTEYQRYVDLNPAHQFNDPRGREELEAVFDPEQNLGNNELVRQMNLMQISVRARLAQIEESVDAWKLYRAATPLAFAVGPRTLDRTFGELLAAPADRVVTPRRLSENALLPPLIIDPLRITPTMIANMGLEDPVQEKGLLQEDQAVLRARLIPLLREMIGSLEPIRRPDEENDALGDLRYFRLMRVASGPNAGYVVGTQMIGGQKVLFKTDLKAAERRLFHIDHGYKEEVSKLAWMQKVIKNLHSHLEFWKDGRRRAAAEKLLETMGQMVDSLEHVKDPAKLEMKKMLGACLNFEDSLGRPNPGAKRAQLTKAYESLGKRLAAIEGISTHLSKDHKKVLEVVAGQKDPLQEVQQLILERKPWPEQVQSFALAEEQVQYQPDLGFAREARALVNGVSAHLDKGERQEASVEYVELYALCKMKVAYAAIWEIYRRLSLEPETQDPAQLLQELQTIEKGLRTKDFATKIKVDAYYKSFVKLYHLINSLKKRLEEHLGVRRVERNVDVTVHENKTLANVLAGLKGQSEVLDRLLQRVTDAPQQDLMALLAVSDPSQKLQTFARMKARIAGFDFNELFTHQLKA